MFQIVDITQLLAFSVKNKASDLHLSAGLPPMIRVHGDVRRLIRLACGIFNLSLRYPHTARRTSS